MVSMYVAAAPGASVGLPKNVTDRREELKRESGKTVEQHRIGKRLLGSMIFGWNWRRVELQKESGKTNFSDLVMTNRVDKATLPRHL